MNLDSKVVLLTGGTDGIGAACVPFLLEAGAKVVLCGLPDGPRPSFDPVRTVTLYGDITEPEMREQLIGETINRFGRIDVLINNAGVGLYLPAHRSPLDKARQMYEVNVFAPLALVQSALPHLRENRGGSTIVNIASVGSWASLPWATLYCASKYSMYALSEGLYRELSKEGIHVITVVPGIVQTSFRKSVLGGDVPYSLSAIRGSITAETMAAAIVRGIERDKRYVIKPWTARPFAHVNRLFPWVVDWYCDTK